MVHIADAEQLSSRLSNLSPELWLIVAHIDEYKGQWRSEAALHPDLLSSLKRSALITSTGASTRIEGAKLTDEAVEKLMTGLSVTRFAERDQQEVRGYYELLQKVFDACDGIRFGESVIKHFHKELLRYVGKDARHRGEYKKQENRVEMIDAAGKSLGVVFDPVPAYLTPKAMQELTEWTTNALKDTAQHPILVIGNFIVEFLHIHPFLDGNGRLSRILTNLLLLKAGYTCVPYVSHEKLIEEHKTEYYLALRRSQTGGDIHAWLQFFLSILLQQTHTAVLLLEKEDISQKLSPQQNVVRQFLMASTECTAGDIARGTRIPRPTVNQALRKLLRLKAITRIGLGSATRYRAL